MSELTIESIKKTESELLLDSVDSDAIYSLGANARKFANKEFPGRDIVIDITSATGNTLFRSYIGSILPDNEQWIKKKRNTVFRFGISSKRFGLELAAKGRTLADKSLSDLEYTNYGGGFPLKLKSAPDFVFAVLTVSGLKEHEDHQLCVDALNYHLTGGV
ncbi:unnamed protein product [Cyberlindnera jadinii]|uniref:DUF967 domain protein n=1 Tax=Cyberlindnera jadinii (strain ATCC 18201 / CBS 1600 / BCRC 20928 / JCM 3617 / NBRC 0987 / NRRL Y-1542) TaxID=983966 RepID=A0A0H5CCZ6_CYBJN|nr:hypothetical protein CYBJADRAFT_160786 [Cyberlindnera jadinii NRRL Y-1542]ODV75357.1 hypothetical protein CYBJADRAFT_160786 [Cyberlindnera jadinii NRRL Y-1542]CEP22499.1 unnamed protein product [Cyberlindnera jadinii]